MVITKMVLIFLCLPIQYSVLYFMYLLLLYCHLTVISGLINYFKIVFNLQTDCLYWNSEVVPKINYSLCTVYFCCRTNLYKKENHTFTLFQQAILCFSFFKQEILYLVILIECKLLIKFYLVSMSQSKFRVR